MQSTHTLGARKTTLWVFNDIKKAIEIVGIQYISFVVLDGACAAVLKMIDTDLQKVFGIRCVTHDEDVEEFFNAFIEENIIAMSEYSL